jgi:hypothetical protein
LRVTAGFAANATPSRVSSSTTQAAVEQPALALGVAASHVGVRAREQHLDDAVVGVPEGRREVRPLLVDRDRVQAVAHLRAQDQVGELERVELGVGLPAYEPPRGRVNLPRS